MILEKLRNLLIEPTVRGHDVDSLEFSLVHRRVLERKAILRELFESFYRECRSMDLRYFGSCPGRRVEIGSGSSRMNQIFPDVITSDIKCLPFVDVVLRAEQMPFPDDGLRAVYAINVFHHLPDPRAFFREMLRVLHPGGGIVLIEPFHGPAARWLFMNLHASEGYDVNAPTWGTLSASGPFSNANQALSYVVFARDQEKFKQEFPDLALLLDRPHTHLWYVASGGVNFRQLAPDAFTPVVRMAEQLLSPLNRWLALQHTLVLRKESSAWRTAPGQKLGTPPRH